MVSDKNVNIPFNTKNSLPCLRCKRQQLFWGTKVSYNLNTMGKNTKTRLIFDLTEVEDVYIADMVDNSFYDSWYRRELFETFVLVLLVHINHYVIRSDTFLYLEMLTSQTW